MSASRPENWMRRAIELSRQGFPAPNPHVGCVIVRDDQIVGEGFHDHAGGPHAETVALDEAGLLARGASAYVTLEPCNHQGRTGPCSAALVDAGIKSVYYAVADPNPRARGGAEFLHRKGVEVFGGILKKEASEANEAFLKAMELKRPFVLLKAACSLDGKIALPNGESKWITGPGARTKAHWLRAQMGAVLVGSGTVTRDDPLLNARIPGVVNQPLKIILDAGARVSKSARAYSGDAPTLRFTPSPEREGDVGLEAPQGRFALDRVLQELWQRNVTSLLVEGGAATLSAFLESNLYEGLELFLAPIIFGEGLSWTCSFKQAGYEEISRLPRLRPVSSQPIDDDLWLSFRRSL